MCFESNFSVLTNLSFSLTTHWMFERGKAAFTLVYCCTCIGSKPVNMTRGVDSGGSFLLGDWISSSLQRQKCKVSLEHGSLEGVWSNSVLVQRSDRLVPNLLYWPGLLVCRWVCWVAHLLLLQQLEALNTKQTPQKHNQTSRYTVPLLLLSLLWLIQLFKDKRTKKQITLTQIISCE